jgi:acetyl-CoA carboxylase biotin carboxyl carrier protein
MRKRSPEKRRGAAAAPRAPAPRAPGYDDLLAIARLVESGSRFTEFRLRSGDIEVEVKRANGAAQAVDLGPGPSPPGARGDDSVAPAKAAAQVPIPDLPAGTHLIKSPMVGTFYRSSEPGAKPFVEPGAKVEPATIVCIIEVMKLMNSVEAGVAGTVTHVFVDNAALVEAGQPLVAIRP